MMKTKDKYSFTLKGEKEIIISVVSRGITKTEGKIKEFVPIEYRISWSDLAGDSIAVETCKELVDLLLKAISLAEAKNNDIKK